MPDPLADFAEICIDDTVRKVAFEAWKRSNPECRELVEACCVSLSDALTKARTQLAIERRFYRAASDCALGAIGRGDLIEVESWVRSIRDAIDDAEDGIESPGEEE